MARYSLAVRSELQLVTATPVLEIIAGATSKVAVVEISMSRYMTGTATSMALGIGRPAAAGVSPVDSGSRFSAEELDGVVPDVRIAQKWTTPPTVPAAFLRRFNFGSGLSARWVLARAQRGISVAPSATLVLWCITGSAVAGTAMFLDANVVINL